jgi:hypothetical protein
MWPLLRRAGRPRWLSLLWRSATPRGFGVFAATGVVVDFCFCGAARLGGFLAFATRRASSEALASQHGGRPQPLWLLQRGAPPRQTLLLRLPERKAERYVRPLAEQLGASLILPLGVEQDGPGEMLNVHDLKAAYEHAIGHPTSNSTIYNLLNRHGWRKLMPRPFHPKRDIAAQKALKKRFSQCREESSTGCRQAGSPLAHHVR